MRHSVLLGMMMCFIAASSCTSEKDTPKGNVLMISLDGFRHDYIEAFNTPTLRTLAATGAKAESIIPVFPSKTFPNHYSIATGLYTENTGIVANAMYDPEFDARFVLSDRSAVQDGRWYGGEPIWNTAERQGVRAATLFWPGSEAEINGFQATYWKVYDGGMSHQARIDTVVSWLSRTDEARPRYANMYFSTPDTYGHYFGSRGDSTRIAIEQLDADLAYLIHRLEETGLRTTTDIVILSDHGMADLSEERLIFLDEIIDLNDVDVYDWTPVAAIAPKPGKEETVYTSLKSAEGPFQVYRKADLPESFHYKNHRRVAEITIVADLGYTILTREQFARSGVIAGAHGYDPEHRDMHGIFIANGPSIVAGTKLPSFRNVHVYSFICELLGIEPAPNDGSAETLRPALKK